MYLGTFMFFDFKIKVPEGQRLLSVCKSLTAVRCWIYCTVFFRVQCESMYVQLASSVPFNLIFDQ